MMAITTDTWIQLAGALIFILGIVATYRSLRRIGQRTKATHQYGIEGELVWLDDSKRKRPFYDKRYHLSGKPDAIYKTAKGYLAFEYKSRKGRTYPSDEAQVLAAALILRGNRYRVTQAMIATQTHRKLIDLPERDSDLYALIEHHVINIQRMRAGGSGEPNPNHYKCRACGYKAQCNYRAA